MPPIFTPVAKKSKPVASSFGDARYGPHRCIAPIIDVLPHHAHALGEAHFRLPAKFTADFRDFGPGAIRFARTLRDMYRRRRSQQAYQFVHANWSPTPHVVNFANFVTFSGCDQGIDDVADKRKIPGLLT